MPIYLKYSNKNNYPNSIYVEYSNKNCFNYINKEYDMKRLDKIGEINSVIPLIKIESFLVNDTDTCIFVKSSILLDIIKILKFHHEFQFQVLISISFGDYLYHTNRFVDCYELLSLKYNTRLTLKILVGQFIDVNSIKTIYITSIQWEDEIWDMFRLVFLKRKNTVRLLTYYGFSEFPLKKDFPVSGFVDLKYNLVTNKVFYNNIRLTQNYRVFNYTSPWNN
jgi:NADH-quinone oxidoreductase subunit C